MTHDDTCGPELRGVSWTVARIIARLYDGDAALLTVGEQAIAREVTGLGVLPTEPPQELYIGAGRRSGKTRLVSVLATHAAAQDYRHCLAPGEYAVAACIAPDRRQARQLFGYRAGIVQGSPILRAEVVRETTDSIEFAHRSRLEVHTGSFRAVRGYTMCFAAVDEAAFLRDERSANPDLELARALKPALKTLGGRLVVISSLHQKRGLMFDAYRRYYAKAGGMRGLFVMAPSLLLNPTLNRADIEAEIADDPEAARGEWLGQFREDIAQFLDDDLIDRVVEPGRKELPFVPRRSYVAFVDSSGGRHDAMTMAIAHPEVSKVAEVEGTMLVLDRLLIESPPFEPEAVVQRFCEQARAFGLGRVTGDKYAGEWVPSMFRKYGLSYDPAERDKSGLYTECLPLFSQGRVRLLDIPRLLTELRLLERRPRSGGRGDIVEHPPNAFDDAANACAGALWLASQKSVRSLQRDRERPRDYRSNYQEFSWG